MELQQIKGLISEIQKVDPNRVSIGEGSSIEAIQAVEKELGVKFCDDYRMFLQEFGLITDGNEDIAGIWRSQADSYTQGTVLYHTKEFNEEYFELGNATVLDPGGDEYYRIINHDDSSIFTYDVFSKKYEKEDTTLFKYILEFLEYHWEIVQDQI